MPELLEVSHGAVLGVLLAVAGIAALAPATGHGVLALHLIRQVEEVLHVRVGAADEAIIDAVAKREIDVAVVWGPLAGYFAKQSGDAIKLQTVTPLIDGPTLPMMFDISMGVRKEDRDLRREVDEALESNRSAIQKILVEYGVPMLEE